MNDIQVFEIENKQNIYYFYVFFLNIHNSYIIAARFSVCKIILICKACVELKIFQNKSCH